MPESIRSAVVSCSTLVFAAAAFAQPETFAPLTVVGGAPGGAYSLSLNLDEYAAMQGTAGVRVPLVRPSDGENVWATLERVCATAPDAVMIGAEGNVEQPLPPAEVQMFRGTLDGAPESRVFLAISPLGTSGYVLSGGVTTIISSGPGGTMPTMIFDIVGVDAGGMDIANVICEGAILAPGSEYGREGGYGERIGTCRTFRLAIDCDSEFTADLFGGSQPAATVYVNTLVGAMTEIFQQETGVAFEIGYLRLWTGTDPYSADSSGGALGELRGYWNANMGGTPRSLAHMLSGRGLGGGIAYLGVACNTSFAYAVMGNMGGYFPYPLMDHSFQNWDIMVHTHETGHNMGTGHTHDSYTPPIDGCGAAYMDPPGVQDCSQAWSGTIMSYCHICPGGMSNINLDFGPRVATVIDNWVADHPSCGITGAAMISQHPASPAPRCVGESASFTVATTGGGLKTYQWRRNAQVVTGATAATYSIPSVSLAQAGLYDCVVTSACGQLTSNPASLVVLTCGCDGDVNCDGNLDGFDVQSMEQAVGGNMADFCQSDADFNLDGNLDGFDVQAVEAVVGGGACP